MLAVSNTSPISNLAHIGRLGLLKLQFPQLWIPNAVKQELERHPSSEARTSTDFSLRGSAHSLRPGGRSLAMRRRTGYERGKCGGCRATRSSARFASSYSCSDSQHRPQHRKGWSAVGTGIFFAIQPLCLLSTCCRSSNRRIENKSHWRTSDAQSC